MKKLLIAAACMAVAAIAVAQATRTATLSWIAVTKDVEGSTITGVSYKVYQGAKGAPKAVVKTGVTTLSQAIPNLAPGETCWQVSANTAGGGESALSNEACKSFPIPAPAAPTLVVD